jgi:hypothetical protein
MEIEFVPSMPELHIIKKGVVKDVTWCLFTYIRREETPLTRQIIKDFFLAKKCDKIIVVEEFGKLNGSLHHHAMVHFKSQYKIRNHHTFDITASGITLHPDIASFAKKDMNKIIKYVFKEDLYPMIVNMEKELSARKAAFKLGNCINRKTNSQIIADLISTAESRQEAYDIARPLTDAGDWQPVKSVIDSSITEKPQENSSFKSTSRYPRSDYNYPQPLLDWIDGIYLTNSKLSRYPVIIISSQSGTGKSQAISALGPRIQFEEGIAKRDLFNIPKEAKFIVYDDLCPEDLTLLGNHKVMLCGMDSDFTTKILYNDPKKTRTHLPSIILCNSPPSWMKQQYWIDNVFWIHIKSSLVKSFGEKLRYEIRNVPRIKFNPIPDMNPDNVVIPKFPPVTPNLEYDFD